MAKATKPRVINWPQVCRDYYDDCRDMGVDNMPSVKRWYRARYGYDLAGNTYYKVRDIINRERSRAAAYIEGMQQASVDQVLQRQGETVRDDLRDKANEFAMTLANDVFEQTVFASKLSARMLNLFARELGMVKRDDDHPPKDPDMDLVIRIWDRVRAFVRDASLDLRKDTFLSKAVETIDESAIDTLMGGLRDYDVPDLITIGSG